MVFQLYINFTNIDLYYLALNLKNTKKAHFEHGLFVVWSFLPYHHCKLFGQLMSI